MDGVQVSNETSDSQIGDGVCEPDIPNENERPNVDEANENENESVTGLNDSVVFVDEYIDLDAPNRSNVFVVKTESSQNDIDFQEANAVTATNAAVINVKTEPSPQAQLDSKDAVDVKPNIIQSGVNMPIAIKEEQASDGGNDSSVDQSEFKTIKMITVKATF